MACLKSIKEVCEIVHSHGGQVYMDGANMNAMVGLCKPREIGADVCHLNLHKTFCIPHGEGPGMGPIGVASHLVDFYHQIQYVLQEVWVQSLQLIGVVPVYFQFSLGLHCYDGARGLKEATQIAILNANYVAKRLSKSYEILYTGKEGFVAHECILDTENYCLRLA